MTLTERHLSYRCGTDMAPTLCQLLRTYSRIECMEKLDTVYALLGMLSEEDPMKALEIDYRISNVTLYLRVTDQWRRWFTSDRLEIEAAEKLRQALELELPALFASTDAEEIPRQRVNHLLLTHGFKINDIDEGTDSLPTFTIEIPDACGSRRTTGRQIATYKLRICAICYTPSRGLVSRSWFATIRTASIV
jgi:hypothetical protein